MNDLMNSLYLARKITLTYGLQSLRYLGAKLWNDIPVEIRNTCTKNSVSYSNVVLNWHWLCLPQ